MTNLSYDPQTDVAIGQLADIRSNIESLESYLLDYLPKRTEQRRQLFDVLVSLERMQDELARLAILERSSEPPIGSERGMVDLAAWLNSTGHLNGGKRA
jgi:hypothetical protein